MAPDLAITQRGPSTAVAPAPPGVATLEPVTIPLLIEELRQAIEALAGVLGA